MKMMCFLISLIALSLNVALDVQAHPTPDTGLESIGTNTKLKLHKKINFPAKTDSSSSYYCHYKQKTIIQRLSCYCAIKLPEEIHQNYDRSLAGYLTVIDTKRDLVYAPPVIFKDLSSERHEVTIYTRTESNNPVLIWCSKDRRFGPLKIQDLMSAFPSIFSIEYPNPIEINIEDYWDSHDLNDNELNI